MLDGYFKNKHFVCAIFAHFVNSYKLQWFWGQYFETFIENADLLIVEIGIPVKQLWV